jgi:ABC-type polysaccharide/polyol phosphate export permease
VLGGSVPWSLIEVSLAMSVLLFILGLLIFRRMERRFADLI